MRAKLANLNHCAVPFLSRAAVKFIWYDSTMHLMLGNVLSHQHKLDLAAARLEKGTAQ